MEPTLLAHPDSAKSSPRLYWGLFLVLLTVISTLPSTPALAQRTTDKTELERMARQFQSQLDRGRTSVYYRLLRSTDPAQAQLNRDESIQLMFMRPSGMPAFYSTDNLNAARTISTDEVWPGGSTGFNRTGGGTASGDLAVWDAGGVRLTHQEFDGRVTQIDGPLGVHFHSNHVAGTMVAEGQDPAARGMSYTAPLDAYDWNSDFAEMTAAGAAGLQVSNHSYGFTSGWSFSGGNWYWYGDLGVSGTEEYGFGFYDANAQAIDQIAYNAPNYLICKSSGNDRDDNGPGPAGGHFHWSGGWVFSNDTHQADGASGGYDCIGWWGNAKNLLTVGAL